MTCLMISNNKTKNPMIVNKNATKKTIYIFFLILLSISCSEGDVTPTHEANDALLTKVSRNGITNIELQYDIDRNLYRLDYYYLGKLTTYYIYEYDGGILRESRRYSAEDHSLEYRSVFTADNFGRIVKGENYSKSDFNEISSINVFEYTSTGLLKSKELIFAEIAISHVEEFSYDNQDNLSGVERILNDSGQEYTSLEITYSPAEQPIPADWQNYILILRLSGDHENILHMFNTSTRYRTYSPNKAIIGEYDYKTSGHLFNDEGNLTQVTITKKNILSPQTPDEVFDLNYEFQ